MGGPPDALGAEQLAVARPRRRHRRRRQRGRCLVAAVLGEREWGRGAARLRPFAIGAWQPVQTLSAAGALGVRPEVTIGPSGGAVAAWLEQVPGQVQTAAREAASGAFSAPAPLGPSGAFGVTLDADGAGTTLAVVQVGGPPNSTWQTALRPPGGPFGALQALPSPSPPIVDAAVGAGGRQFAVGPEPGEDPKVVVFSTRTGAGAWSVFAPISPAGPAVEVSAAQVALDGDGNPTVLWQRAVEKSNGQGNVATTVAADGPAAGPFGAPVRLSPADKAAPTVGLGVNAQGTAVALWGRTSGSNDGLEGAVRLGPSASWLSPEEVLAPEAGLGAIGPPGRDGRRDRGRVLHQERAGDRLRPGRGEPRRGHPHGLATPDQPADRPGRHPPRGCPGGRAGRRDGLGEPTPRLPAAARLRRQRPDCRRLHRRHRPRRSGRDDPGAPGRRSGGRPGAPDRGADAHQPAHRPGSGAAGQRSHRVARHRPGRTRHQGRRDRPRRAGARHQHRLDLGPPDATPLGEAERRGRGRRRGRWT